MEISSLKEYLERALSGENYKAKFDRVIQPNEFSVSTLVDGPGAAIKYRMVNYDPSVLRKFNLYFFRGSAIHEKINEYIAKDNWLLKQEVSMDLSANNGDPLKIYGHPDAINCVEPVVLEFKTMDSEDLNYRRRALQKASRQVAAYAKMQSIYDEEVYEAFVVFLDFVRKTPLTERQMEQGFGLKNGLVEYQLTEMDLEYGQVLNDQIVIFKLTQEEIDHGYNYVRWCARESWDRLNSDEFTAGVM